MGKAIHRYGMIQDGDHIAVGLSGGKDSLALLWMLKNRLARIPVHYDLSGIYIDPGYDDGSTLSAIERFCRELSIDLIAEKTDHGLVAHSEVNRENPCFLCSRLRRKRLFEIAHSLGSRKLALGHHKDDIIETFFMNICYAGETSTMMPVQPFFNGLMTVIRPLAFVDERTIRQFSRDHHFPETVNRCPSAGHTRRNEIKRLLSQLYRDNRKVKGNIFRAMHHVKMDYMLK